MTDRALKRAWLRLIGAIDDGEPSTSAQNAIDVANIDSTLGSIQDDDTWVALACLDAIQTRSDVADQMQVCKHLLQLGLRRSEVDENLDLKDQATLHTLAIRNQLYTQLRLVEIWEDLYQNKRSEAKADDPRGAPDNATLTDNDEKEDDEDDFEAWAEVAETTPSPLPLSDNFIGLADFLRQDIVTFIMQLAKFRDAEKVSIVIKALTKPLLNALYLRRLDLTTELLLSFALAKNDLKRLLHLRLLPGVSERGETGLIAEMMRAPSNRSEIINRSDVQEALTGQITIADEEASDKGLFSSQLLRYYHDRIISLQSEKQLTSAAAQLSAIVTSGILGLPADDVLSKTSEELQLLLPLTRTRNCDHWTLDRFRQEIMACHDLQQKQSLARLYLEESQTAAEAAMAARDGAVPYLQYINRKQLNHLEEGFSAAKLLSNGFQHAILALADEGNIRVVIFLLEESSACGVDVSQVSKRRIALSCVLAASDINLEDQQELNRLISSKALSITPAADQSHSQTPFAAIANLDESDDKTKTPSEIFKSLANLDDSAISHHLQRCQKYLTLCHLSLRWNNTLTPAFLAGMQGQEARQRGCIARAVRAFAKDFKSSDQWKHMIDALIESSKADGVFDALSPNDVAKLAIEGALGAGDLRTYTSTLQSISKTYLSSEEEEQLILNASRGFYDNATSSNVHQGDMKTAYEVLSAYGPTLTLKIEKERAFIEATSRLCSFRVQSSLRSGSVVALIEIRLSHDRLEFIKKLLESKEDAYKTPELIIEMALKLCAVPSGSADAKGEDQIPSKIVVESRTLALLTEAALGQADYAQAQNSCERLVSNIQSLTKRLQQSLLNKGTQHDQLESQYHLVRESAYRTCFLVCNQHDWTDYASRLRWASFVLAYCPEEQIDRYLKAWRQLEDQFQKDLIDNPPPNNWDQMGAHLKAGQAGGLAGSLAAIGNFGGLESLGPFSNLFASAKMPSLSASSLNKAKMAEIPKETVKTETVTSPASRAAKLFDSLGSGPNNASTNDAPNMTYLDPAERAARAARRFFGGFGS